MLKRYASLLLLSSILAILTQSAPAMAVSASDWRAGNIVDDGIFYDNASMSESEIQAFLNSKVTSCDTQGTQSAADIGYPNMTHAQYAAMVGWPSPPYVCIKDYYQVPDSSRVITNFSGSIPSGAISAARIIKIAADTYGISPKVLITTLHKESLNLIFDNWPLLSQYRNSMGYGCPDTAPCDPQYEGFYNQMMNAARQFNLYRTAPGSYRYRVQQDNSIYYNPNYSCGSSIVFISTQATAGLYNYTPYQPNQAALNNLYGSGDSCSAYGNRNFWRIYNDWFGSTIDPFDNSSIRLTTSLSITPSAPVQNQTYTASYKITNSANYPISIGSPFVMVRGPQDQNLDIPADQNITIPANSTYTYSKQWSTPYAGTHTFQVVLYKDGLGISRSNPVAANTSVLRGVTVNVKDNPRLVGNLTATPSSVLTGDSFTASFSVRNDSDVAVDFGYPFVVIRGPQGQNVDIGISGERVSIPANSTYTYSKQWSTPYAGTHTLSVATWIPERGILNDYPVSDGGVTRSTTVTFR
jgi:hypothetical protein